MDVFLFESVEGGGVRASNARGTFEIESAALFACAKVSRDIKRDHVEGSPKVLWPYDRAGRLIGIRVAG